MNSKHGAKLKIISQRSETQKNKTDSQRSETQENKTQKDQNLVLSKEWVESADLYKPILNKIMTAHE